jgi:hypothetical protein
MEKVEIKKEWEESFQFNDQNENSNKQSPIESDSESDTKYQYPFESLIHVFTESRSLHKMRDKIIEIAPA